MEITARKRGKPKPFKKSQSYGSGKPEVSSRVGVNAYAVQTAASLTDKATGFYPVNGSSILSRQAN